MPTILVADDNSNIHKMVDLALKDLGYKIEKVGNGEHAVRKLPEIKPDLILADIFMPVRNGYEVCEFVKNSQEFSHVPVVLLQGKFDPLDEHEMKRVRADGLLMKPFVPPDPLVTMVKELLEEAARRHEAAPSAPSPSPESTVEMSREEVAALTGADAPEAPPEEPEIPEYAVPPPPIEIKEGDNTLAFGDLLSPSEEAEPKVAPPEEGFRASSLADVDTGETEETTEEAEPAPSWGGIEEELKKPTPDEPPIKVEFGESEPLELVTEETPEAPSVVDSGPLPELATSPDEWMASGPPAGVSAPVESAESWEVSPPAPSEAEGTKAQAPAKPPPPPPEIPPRAPQAYEKPALEELPTPPPRADAVPAEAPAAAQSFAAPPAVDSAMVDAVVEKVLARLQPKIVEQITREIVRPLAEALLQKELEKK